MKPNEILKQLRESKGCTIQEISKKIGMQYSVCREYESGDRNLGMSAAIKFADFYKVSLDYLLGRPEAKPPKNAIDSLIEEHSLHTIEESLLRMYFKLEPKKRAEFMQSVLDDVQKNMLAEDMNIPQKRDSNSMSVTTTLGELEDRQAVDEEAHAKDAG